MAKAVFRPEELTVLSDKVIIESPTSYPDLAHLASVEEIEEIPEEIEEYTGPTADDLRREAEAFKAQWESEKQILIDDAKLHAQGIISEAQEKGADEVNQKTGEAQAIVAQAQQEAEKIIGAANEKAREIEEEGRSIQEAAKKEAEENGRQAGHEAGYASGKAEVERLIERTQQVLERAQDKRSQILAETEQQIVDMVLLITRKVVKVISESQRNVVVSNVIQALRKVRAKGNVIIRVNIADLKLTTEHTKDFIRILEDPKSIQVMEDPTVDPGGCIIETDFGEIDARISSQLSELESRILDVSPIKPRPKNLTAKEMTPETTAALTASAALAAFASLSSSNDPPVPEKDKI